MHVTHEESLVYILTLVGDASVTTCKMHSRAFTELAPCGVFYSISLAGLRDLSGAWLICDRRLIVCRMNWLIDLLIDPLIDWSFCRSIDWLIDWCKILQPKCRRILWDPPGDAVSPGTVQHFRQWTVRTMQLPSWQEHRPSVQRHWILLLSGTIWQHPCQLSTLNALPQIFTGRNTKGFTGVYGAIKTWQLCSFLWVASRNINADDDDDDNDDYNDDDHDDDDNDDNEVTMTTTITTTMMTIMMMLYMWHAVWLLSFQFVTFLAKNNPVGEAHSRFQCISSSSCSLCGNHWQEHFRFRSSPITTAWPEETEARTHASLATASRSAPRASSAGSAEDSVTATVVGAARTPCRGAAATRAPAIKARSWPARAALVRTQRKRTQTLCFGSDIFARAGSWDRVGFSNSLQFSRTHVHGADVRANIAIHASWKWATSTLVLPQKVREECACNRVDRRNDTTGSPSSRCVVGRMTLNGWILFDCMGDAEFGRETRLLRRHQSWNFQASCLCVFPGLVSVCISRPRVCVYFLATVAIEQNLSL